MSLEYSYHGERAPTNICKDSTQKAICSYNRTVLTKHRAASLQSHRITFVLLGKTGETGNSILRSA